MQRACSAPLSLAKLCLKEEAKIYISDRRAAKPSKRGRVRWYRVFLGKKQVKKEMELLCKRSFDQRPGSGRNNTTFNKPD